MMLPPETAVMWVTWGKMPASRRKRTMPRWYKVAEIHRRKVQDQSSWQYVHNVVRKFCQPWHYDFLTPVPLQDHAVNQRSIQIQITTGMTTDSLTSLNAAYHQVESLEYDRSTSCIKTIAWVAGAKRSVPQAVFTGASLRSSPSHPARIPGFETASSLIARKRRIPLAFKK